ncbi:secondary thiamine-phosphate synthase enzyme [candidate division TA06 bacterium DG_24]|uniref:Secondary thiamine-phosphate synthase enzyme n=2 Tax=Bacteria division TA06 TaxID=1156500 RepID=A0A0S8G708_UNCT6|nr:MAG: secondary thiamine-phosphate synthase enzyme [candidate division TA06 bacterium DG_24]KPK67610.1 MAG: secondary thiamine-phosphate synthase enzyme [candidate division TA06 bacterium SM23_40]
MAVVSRELKCRTKGNGDAIDITGDTARVVQESRLRSGIVTLFVPGSTGAVTTIEFEPGAVSDLNRLFDEIVPPNRDYQHHLRWGDDNGHSHVRAALLGPSLTVPFADGELSLGTWQQIVFVDFDTGPRQRRIVAQVIGE